MDATAQTIQAFTTLPAPMLAAIGCLFGCLVGSFLNVVAHRLPLMIAAEEAGDASSGISLSYPSSHCPQCGHALSWYENIPLLSFMMQRGKCRHCGARISWRYPLLEALAGMLGGLAIWKYGLTIDGAAIAVFLLALLALTAIDLDTGLLPDKITLPLLWLGLLAAAAGHGPAPAAAILAAAAGYAALDGLNRVSRLITGQDGMGGGDMKMAAMMGAWLGPEGLVFALFLAFASGAAYGLLLRLLQRIAPSNATDQNPASQDDDLPPGALPFGPWLALGAAVTALWPEIVNVAIVWFQAGSY